MFSRFETTSSSVSLVLSISGGKMKHYKRSRSCLETKSQPLCRLQPRLRCEPENEICSRVHGQVTAERLGCQSPTGWKAQRRVSLHRPELITYFVLWDANVLFPQRVAAWRIDTRKWRAALCSRSLVVASLLHLHDNLLHTEARACFTSDTSLSTFPMF